MRRGRGSLRHWHILRVHAVERLRAVQPKALQSAPERPDGPEPCGALRSPAEPRAPSLTGRGELGDEGKLLEGLLQVLPPQARP